MLGSNIVLLILILQLLIISKVLFNLFGCFSHLFHLGFKEITPQFNTLYLQIISLFYFFQQPYIKIAFSLDNQINSNHFP